MVPYAQNEIGELAQKRNFTPYHVFWVPTTIFHRVKYRALHYKCWINYPQDYRYS